LAWTAAQRKRRASDDKYRSGVIFGYFYRTAMPPIRKRFYCIGFSEIIYLS
jgi:hypothetical protein